MHVGDYKNINICLDGSFQNLNAFIFWDIPVFCIWKPAKWKNSSPVQSLILWWYIWVAEWDDLSVEVTGLD